MGSSQASSAAGTRTTQERINEVAVSVNAQLQMAAAVRNTEARLAAVALALIIFPWTGINAGNSSGHVTDQDPGKKPQISASAHYVLRDGLRIYLWEKYQRGLETTFGTSGKVALLVHGGTWSGRPDFDLQIRDYSLMDFLAAHGYDVWAIDIHGYGHSDRTDKDWSGAQPAAADIGAAVQYISKLRGLGKIDLLGWSAGTLRAGLYAMQHPERVQKLILYAPTWKGSAEYREQIRRKIENGGKPLAQYRDNTETAARSDFVAGELATRPQFDEDVVAFYAREALRTDPQSPNAFVDYVNFPILDPLRITVPTMIIFGEYDYFAKQEDLVPFFSQLQTWDKRLVILPHAGHALMLERDHRRFQQEVLGFFDRP
jgi:pimeloyl-ACP methyl ester carboxylesterase